MKLSLKRFLEKLLSQGISERDICLSIVDDTEDLYVHEVGEDFLLVTVDRGLDPFVLYGYDSHEWIVLDVKKPAFREDYALVIRVE